MARYWMLDETHTPVVVDINEWATWFEHIENRRVAMSFTMSHRISTVFVGLDYSFSKGPPLLFETMVFPSFGYQDEECWRYASWDDAVTGHETAVKRVRNREKAEAS